jgi:hypothetical protein
MTDRSHLQGGRKGVALSTGLDAAGHWAFRSPEGLFVTVDDVEDFPEVVRHGSSHSKREGS